jgi:hypothetical protein
MSSFNKKMEEVVVEINKEVKDSGDGIIDEK